MADSEIEELISLHKPFNKPILVEEFGLTNNGKLGPTDANASLMKLFIERARQAGAIAVMPWWWDENIDRNNLYAVIGGGTVS